MKRLLYLLLVFLLFLSLPLEAQEEGRDTLRLPVAAGTESGVGRGEIQTAVAPFSSADDSAARIDGLVPRKNFVGDSLTSCLLRGADTRFSLPYWTNPSSLFRGDYATQGQMYRFSRGGALYGEGSQYSLPGIGRMNEASAFFVQPLTDRLLLTTRMDLSKTNVVHYSGLSAGFSAGLLYQTDTPFSFRLFGTYDTGSPYTLRSTLYGGSLLYAPSDRFTIEAGVMRYRDPVTGRWETRPMLIPSYKFSEKFQLGLDVGGLLYQLLHDVVVQPRSRRYGPTIAPQVER